MVDLSFLLLVFLQVRILNQSSSNQLPLSQSFSHPISLVSFVPAFTLHVEQNFNENYIPH